MPNVAVVGGGMLGLTLALRLRQRGHDVVVLEASAGVGGLAAPQRLGEVTWDRFYHVTLMSDASLLELLSELGLSTQLRWGVTRTGFYGDGHFASLSSSLDFLRFPYISLADKARLAATILYASRLDDGAPLERLTAVEWLTRWSGTRVVERIWLPLLRSKLGARAESVSAAFIWAIIRRMYAARRSGLKREMFGYVDGGYDRVLRVLRERLIHEGVVVVDRWPVREILQTAQGVELRSTDGRTREAAAAIVTLPCGRVANATPQLTERERERLDRVVYQGIICASALLTKPLGGYYVTNIVDSGFPFTTIVEMTALVDRARFGGDTLIYLPRYVTAEDPAWSWSDEEVRRRFLAGLTRMYPAVGASDVKEFRVSRVREVLALSTLDYSRDALPPTETSLDRIFVVNSAQIAHGTLNVNETVALANAKAAMIAPRLAASAELSGAAR